MRTEVLAAVTLSGGVRAERWHRRQSGWSTDPSSGTRQIRGLNNLLSKAPFSHL